MFPVRSPEGRVRDEFAVRIELLWDYPRSLPIVWETGGRIPSTAARHMEAGSRACVLLPDARWEEFPEGAAFIEFLEGPLHNFFLGQSVVDAGGDWPFGEWEHGGDGVRDYYRDLLGTDDDKVIMKTLGLIAKASLKVGWDCPCGSGRRLRRCCRMKIVELRRKIRPEVARSSLRHLRYESSRPKK